jgi:hypothetical protein
VSDGRPELIARDRLIPEVVRLADRLGIASEKAGHSVPK